MPTECLDCLCFSTVLELSSSSRLCRLCLETGPLWNTRFPKIIFKTWFAGSRALCMISFTHSEKEMLLSCLNRTVLTWLRSDRGLPRMMSRSRRARAAFKGNFYREKHLWEPLGQTDKIALCLIVVSASLAEVLPWNVLLKSRVEVAMTNAVEFLVIFSVPLSSRNDRQISCQFFTGCFAAANAQCHVIFDLQTFPKNHLRLSF